MYLLQLLYLFLLPIALTGVSGEVPTDICKLPRDHGACSTIFLAWYYDWDEKQCNQFVYGGCGGNLNRFPSEEECYIRCAEQLIDLHPPEKVSIPFVLADTIYLYWEHPRNFRIHDPTNETHTIAVDFEGNLILTPKGPGLTGKGPGVTHEVLTLNGTVGSVNKGSESAEPQQNGKASTSDGNADKQQHNSTTNSGAGTQNADKETNNGKETGVGNQNTATGNINNNDNSTANSTTNSEDSGPETGKDGKTNTTESVINNANTSVGSNSSDTKAYSSTPAVAKGSDHTTVKPPVVTPNSSDPAIRYELEDYYWKEKVPFHFAVLGNYIVSYKKDLDEDWINLSLSQNTTEVSIRNLTAGTVYTIRVGAVYLTHTEVFSPELKVTTLPDSLAPKNCKCHPMGTVGGAKNCSDTTHYEPWCRCRPGYSGLFCELCHSGYYRIHKDLECHKCPCSSTASSGHCYFFEGYLHCLGCKEGYVGRMCQHCDNGYYRDHRTSGSVCTKCIGCHNVGQGLLCEPSTGKCINCHYNTTGHQCDKCLPGFEGDPLKNISCKWIETHRAGPQMLSSGIVAMIVVVTILFLSAIVGCIIYRKMRNYPHSRPFWTIELKEGHEGVNFSSVPDDDVDRYHDDVRLMEKESKGKAQPYLRLQEDI